MYTFIGQLMHLRGNVWFSILHRGTYINLMAKKEKDRLGEVTYLSKHEVICELNYSATDTTP